MLKKLMELWKRDPCKECIYYSKENNVCHVRKIETCGNHPYVSRIDKMLCTPRLK